MGNPGKRKRREQRSAISADIIILDIAITNTVVHVSVCIISMYLYK